MTITCPVRCAAVLLGLVVASFASAGAGIAEASGLAPGHGPSTATGDCEGIDASVVADLPVGDAIEEIDNLATFAAAISASDLSVQLAADGPFTVFAPSNDAFGEIPENVWEAIMGDPELLSSILGYHVVAGEALGAEDVAAAGTAETLRGTLDITAEGDVLRINGGEANVTCAGVEAADGTIFVIDRVLQPPTSELAGGGTSVPGASVPGSSVPGSSVPGSSVAG